jgi:MutS-like protein
MKRDLVCCLVVVLSFFSDGQCSNFSYEKLEQEAIINLDSQQESLKNDSQVKQEQVDPLLQKQLFSFVFDHLKKHQEKHDQQASGIKDPVQEGTLESLRDLSIVKGPKAGPNESILGLFNKHTRTLVGKIAMASLLADIPDKVSSAQTRGQFLQRLGSDATLKGKVVELVDAFSAAESTFLTGSNNKFPSPFDAKRMDMVYWFGNNATAVNVADYVKTHMYALYMGIFSVAVGGIVHMIEEKKLIELMKNAYFIVGILLAYDAVFVQYPEYKNMRDLCKSEKPAADVLELAQHVDNLMQEYPEVERILNGAPHTRKLLDDLKHDETEFGELLRLLKKPTFKEVSLLCHRGNVLVARKLLEEHAHKFIPFLSELGTLDALHAVHSFIKSLGDSSTATKDLTNLSGSSKLPVCEVSFVKDSPSPVLHLTDFWNPQLLIDKDRSLVVSSSLDVGKKDAKTLVVTGVNTSGKTSTIIGLGLNVWLAQILGIALARKAVMSHFNIATAINVGDRIGTGDSLFKAEVKRAKNICKIAEKKEKEKSPLATLIIADELFKGTNEHSGGKIGKEFLQHLAETCKTCLTVFATHIENITDLGKQNPASYKNYMVPIKKDNLGNIIRTHKLEPGINTDDIAAEIVREELKDFYNQKR